LRFLGVITQRILNISMLKGKTLDQEERQILATDINGKKHDIDVNVFPTAKGPGFKMHLCEGINSETETTNGNNTENNTLKDFLNIPVAGDNKVKDLLILPVAGIGVLVLLFLCNLGSYLVTGENDFIEESFHLKSQSARKTESVAVSESSERVTQPTSAERVANPLEVTSAKPDSSPLPANSDQSVAESFRLIASSYMKQVKAQARRMTIEITAGNEYAKATNSMREAERKIARTTGNRVPDLDWEQFYRVVGYYDIQSDYSIDVKKNDSIISPYIGIIRTKKLFVPTKVVECEPPSMRNIIFANLKKYETWKPLVIECSYQNGKWTIGKNLKQTLER
jgi:hypothetical protein